MPSLSKALALLLVVATLVMPGCRCRQETPQERAAREQREEEDRLKKLEEAKKKQQKPPLEVKLPLPQPSQADRPAALIKPGHWMAVTQATKANHNNWVGRTQQQIVGGKDQPIPIERTAFALRTSRDAAVAKGKEKRLETFIFPPNSFESRRLRTSLFDRGGGYAVPPSSLGLSRMLPHQYHFVVLAAEPERYSFLRNGNYAIDSPTSPHISVGSSTEVDTFFSSQQYDRNYYVVAPAADKRLPLSDNPLCWTTTAYVLWDEVDPEQLDAAQRTAMIDWLHWGGQLIVSGPDSLDLLAESFLAPYLPADAAGPRRLDAAALAELRDTYHVGHGQPPALGQAGAWSGVRLKLRPEAQPLAVASDLFAERRVGRGRVIVSSMQLAERELINWAGGFENLFNALLLRRPPRRFAWENLNDGVLYVRNVQRNTPQLDAGANTRLRYFARDTHADPDALRYREASRGDQDATVATGRFNRRDFDTATYTPGGEAGGAGGWSDFNATASAAREALREAAGVKVPRRSFVLGCLAAYLTVIGPFNWFFFKALGRVELAWVAAPVITTIGAVAVVRLAELDIGFARAQTEIAVLETQPDHPRAHLTRYTAVYTSLATTYEFASDEPTTLVAPFPRSENFELLRGQSLTNVTFERKEKVRLRGFAISSAATDMAHVEQMISLPQGVRYDSQRRRLTNGTGAELRSLAIVRREDPPAPARGKRAPPRLVGCWIGTLAADTSTTAAFTPIAFSDEAPAFAAERATEASRAPADRLNLEPLFRMALDPQSFEPGEVRAVGRIDKVLPGLEVAPRAVQSAGTTLVVAHLEYAPLPAPVSDANAPGDVRPRP